MHSSMSVRYNNNLDQFIVLYFKLSDFITDASLNLGVVTEAKWTFFKLGSASAVVRTDRILARCLSRANWWLCLALVYIFINQLIY